MTEDQTVLLVDDSENDLLLSRLAFNKAGFNARLQTVGDGETAIAYLKGEARFGDRERFPLPAAVLLDLNMPKMTGFDLLSFVRNEPAFHRIPFIVLTASARSEDVQTAYDLRAHAYLVKPTDIERLVSMIRSLLDWLLINHFPPSHDAARK